MSEDASPTIFQASDPGENVKDEWHWTERDLNTYEGWVQQTLTQLFRGLALVSDRHTEIVCYAARAEGEAILNRRKGKHSVMWSLELIIKWKAHMKVGDTSIGASDGRVLITDVASDNEYDPDGSLAAAPESQGKLGMWPLSVKSECECHVQEQQRREPDQMESSLRDAVRADAVVAMIRQKVVEFQQELRKLLTNRPEDVAEALSRQMEKEMHIKPKLMEEGSKVVAEEASKLTASQDEYLKTMRRKLKAQRFLDIVDKTDGRGNEEEWMLSFTLLKDEDVDELLQILDDGGGQRLTKIDLSRNEISDVSVRELGIILGSGAAPALKELNLTNNKEISKIGENILSGLKLMRKGVKILV